LLFEKTEGFQAAVLLEIFLQEESLKWPESRFFLRTFPPHTKYFCKEFQVTEVDSYAAFGETLELNLGTCFIHIFVEVNLKVKQFCVPNKEAVLPLHQILQYK